MVDRLLILALGNPILSDDRVGLEVARLVHARLPGGHADLVEASVGGFELLHVLEGYERVLIVDALEPGLAQPAEILELTPRKLVATAPLTPHNAGLEHALELGRACGLKMPADIVIMGIGVRDPYRFGETCTPEVAAQVPQIAERIYAAVFGSQGRWPA